MNDTLKALVELTGQTESKLASAALLVLSHLAPPDRGVVEGLQGLMERKDHPHHGLIIETLGRIATPLSTSILIKLLAKDGPDREDALRALTIAGKVALEPLAKVLASSPLELRTRVAEILAHFEDKQAYALLIRGMKSGTFFEIQVIRRGIQNALPSLTPMGKRLLFEALAKAFNDKAMRNHMDSVLAMIELLGELGEARALSLIQPFLSQLGNREQTRLVLNALAKLPLQPKERSGVMGDIFALLETNDYSNVIEPALRVLEGAQAGKEHWAKLQGLVRSPHGQVREFALRQLAALGESKNLQKLVEQLGDPDGSVRNEASKALMGVPKAAGLVARKFAALTCPEACWNACRLLIALAPHIPASEMEGIAQAFLELSNGPVNGMPSGPDAGRLCEERKKAILALCRATGNEALVGTALKQARTFRVQGEPQKAMALLRSVSGMPGWSHPHRVEQALSGLTFGSQDFARGARATDQNLRLLSAVLLDDKTAPAEISKLVLKDKLVSPRILYYIGFHFCEGVGNERAFGQAVLVALAGRSGIEESALAAHKLRLEGLYPAPSKAPKTEVLLERGKVMASVLEISGTPLESGLPLPSKAKGMGHDKRS